MKFHYLSVFVLLLTTLNSYGSSRVYTYFGDLNCPGMPVNGEPSKDSYLKASYVDSISKQSKAKPDCKDMEVKANGVLFALQCVRFGRIKTTTVGFEHKAACLEFAKRAERIRSKGDKGSSEAMESAVKEVLSENIDYSQFKDQVASDTSPIVPGGPKLKSSGSSVACGGRSPLLEGDRGVPVRAKDGKGIEGIQMLVLGENSLLSQAGMQQKDIFKAVNDTALTSMDVVVNLGSAFKGGKNILKVQRGDKIIQLTLNCPL